MVRRGIYKVRLVDYDEYTRDAYFKAYSVDEVRDLISKEEFRVIEVLSIKKLYAHSH